MRTSIARLARILPALGLCAVSAGCGGSPQNAAVSVIVPWAAGSNEYSAFQAVIKPFEPGARCRSSCRALRRSPSSSTRTWRQATGRTWWTCRARPLSGSTRAGRPAAAPRHQPEFLRRAVAQPCGIGRHPVRGSRQGRCQEPDLVQRAPSVTPDDLGGVAGPLPPGHPLVPRAGLGTDVRVAGRRLGGGHPAVHVGEQRRPVCGLARRPASLDVPPVRDAWQTWGALMRYGAAVYGGALGAPGALKTAYNSSMFERLMTTGQCELERGALAATGLTPAAGDDYVRSPRYPERSLRSWSPATSWGSSPPTRMPRRCSGTSPPQGPERVGKTARWVRVLRRQRHGGVVVLPGRCATADSRPAEARRRPGAVFLRRGHDDARHVGRVLTGHPGLHR